MYNCGILGFVVILGTALTLSTNVTGAPSFQDINIGSETGYEDNIGDPESIENVPIVDAVALQRLLLLLDSLSSSGARVGYHQRRLEAKNPPGSILNSLYGPPAHNARSTMDMFEGKRTGDRSRKEDKRGSYTPCFFNPVSCFGK